MLEVAKTTESQENITQVIDLLEDAKKFFYRIGDIAIEKKVAEMAAQVEEPLYLVVAGEYNSGKSSFINALCGEKVLPEGPIPTTHKITLLTYGEEKTSVDIDDHQCRKTYPLEALKDFIIVDTPGTNSIITEHQAITEGFIHRAELIFFVTSADHPFTESERVFLQLLKGKWGRRIVFILNKIDLKNKEELEEIKVFVEKNFYRLFAFEPKIIPVSTKNAYDAKISGDNELLDKSNIAEVESFTFEKLDYETKINFKILSPLRYILNVFGDLEEALDNKTAQCNEKIKTVEMFEKRLANKKQDMRDYILKYKTETNSVFSKLKEKVDGFLNYYVNTRAIITMKFAREKIDDKFKREVFGFANPRSEMERITKDAMEYVDRNNNVLWDMAHDYVEASIVNPKSDGEISKTRNDHYFTNRGTEQYFKLSEYSEQFRELDGEIEAEKIYRVVQNAFVNFVVLEGLAIGIIISLSTFLSFVIPNMLGVTVAIILAGIGFTIYPLKRKKYRTEFVNRTDAICERFSNRIMFEFEKVVDRVIEDIGNKISAYRDIRWSEREEANRQISELRLLAERTKDLIRKSDHK